MPLLLLMPPLLSFVFVLRLLILRHTPHLFFAAAMIRVTLSPLFLLSDAAFAYASDAARGGGADGDARTAVPYRRMRAMQRAQR